jgi:hypothetical protein
MHFMIDCCCEHRRWFVSKLNVHYESIQPVNMSAIF